jgi:tRNA-dihydrouridine synthase A
MPQFPPHRFCIAPMMEWTDRHCRMLHRALSARARLYTEMVAAEAVIRGKRDQLLGFDAAEHPLAVQLGGAEPSRLAEAAKICEDFCYDEINLNAGCPSDKVQSGRFGACLMKEPRLAADCLGAMRAAVSIPVSLKCRIGVDGQEPEIALRAMIAAAKDAGIRIFIVHARKAWLKGLSPKQNRSRPPLACELVYTVKRENPDCTIVVNGGIVSLAAAKTHLRHVDGAMLGRAAYQNPGILADVDAELFGGEARTIEAAIADYLPYIEAKLAEGVPLNSMVRHMLGLFAERPGARAFRRHLSENAGRAGAGIDVLKDALALVMGKNILPAP